MRFAGQRGLEMHGKVVVTIQRGNSVKTGAKKSRPELWNGYVAPNTQASSKAVVKGKHISHAIRHMILKDGKQPETVNSSLAKSGHKWQALRGPGGDCIEFTIRYRSRDALQRLKIIPKDKACIDLTLSPPPSLRVKSEERINSSGEAKQDGRGIAALKREPGIDVPVETHEARPSANAAATALADTHSLANQHDKKRKAMEDELKEVELEQKRLRLVRGLAELDAAQ